ncbi:hypothetical protein Tco_0183189 [Tanacetum coccineum]
MDNPDITMEEYIQMEIEKALRRGQVFNWETATYGMVRYFEDIDYFKKFETKFPAIVYKDALTSEPEVSCELTDSFSYKIIFANDVKSDTDNDDGKINVKLPFENIFIEPLDSDIDTNVDTYSHAFGENFETNHDTPSKTFTIKDFVIMIKVVIQKCFSEGMSLIFIIKNLYVLFGIPFDPKRFYKDGAYTRGYEGQGLHTEEEMDTDGFRAYWTKSLREIASKANLSDYWARISYAEDRNLKRKQGDRMSGGHFIARLGVHFGVIIKESLWTLTVEVAMGPKRHHVRAAAGVAYVNPEVAEEGIQADPAPVKAAHVPQAAPPAPRTMP